MHPVQCVPTQFQPALASICACMSCSEPVARGVRKLSLENWFERQDPVHRKTGSTKLLHDGPACCPASARQRRSAEVPTNARIQAYTEFKLCREGVPQRSRSRAPNFEKREGSCSFSRGPRRSVGSQMQALGARTGRSKALRTDVLTGGSDMRARAVTGRGCWARRCGWAGRRGCC